MEEYIEFEEINPDGSPLERVLDNKVGFRKEYRVQPKDDVEIYIRGNSYKILNLSSHGFQIVLRDIDDINTNIKIDFKLFFDNYEINGVGVVKYIEKIDLDSFGVGIKIESFSEQRQKENYIMYVKRLRDEILSGNV